MNDLSFADNISGVTPLHSHGGFEAVCFDGEGGVVETDGASYEFEGGEVAIIPPLLPHIIRCHTAECALIERAVLPVKGVLRLTGAAAEELLCTLARARARLNRDEQGGAVFAAYGSLAAALIAEDTDGGKLSPTVRAVADDIKLHLNDPTYSLEGFMRSLPLNYDYVRKLFKKELGLTPHEYLVNARMERARDIILSGATNRYSEYTVTQIAEECGFSEPLYFSRVFKKYFGVAPSLYSKR